MQTDLPVKSWEQIWISNLIIDQIVFRSVENIQFRILQKLFYIFLVVKD
jgi:hypothetical protein